MIAAALILFREMLEMALVLGVLLAATGTVPTARRWIGLGTLVGAAGAVVLAVFMEQLESSFDGDGEFLFNAVVLAVASALIGWTTLWMQRHGREMSARMRAVGAAVHQGEAPVAALATIAAAAVMREGSEAVFFLFGAIQATDDEGWGLLAGALLGVVGAILIGWGVFRGLRRIPLDRIFTVVSALLVLIAAGMASQAAWNLVAIDRLPPLVDPLWDSSALLDPDGVAGGLLHALIGYDPQPSGMQMAVFLTVLLLLGTMVLRRRPEREPR
ncbi:MAG: iron permease [Zetaproteobacteria bacterium]|nr:MAG: iron permease [Zetaproteobacteria bacterium]